MIKKNYCMHVCYFIISMYSNNEISSKYFNLKKKKIKKLTKFTNLYSNTPYLCVKKFKH